jgi:WD40 repeat protein
MPSRSRGELCAHHRAVSAIRWAPHSASLLCSVGEDGGCFIWDLSRSFKSTEKLIFD